MSTAQASHSDSWSSQIVGYLTILAVAIIGIQLLDPGWPRALAIGLMIGFGVLYALSPKIKNSLLLKHAYFIVQTLIVAGLLVLQPQWGSFPILFFVLSAQAMLEFPERNGYFWMGVFTVVSGSTFLTRAPIGEGLMALLLYGVGYWFFGAFARAMAAADEARARSQALLEELQVAHRKLQDYAVQVEELAVAEERNRLAREMHDTLGHRLTVAAVQLEGAERLIPDKPGRAVQMVATVRNQVREALAELRRTVATLREPLETDLTLEKALSRLTASFEDATDLKVQVRLPTEERTLPEAHRMTIYRATQEALTNVQRHAQAQRVWVHLMYDDNRLVLEIYDDGVGISTAHQPAGFGLRGLQERAVRLNGEFEMENRAEGGTRLRLSLPLREEVHDE